jgi:serine/threonine protein kinase
MGNIIGNYELVSELKRGGMGVLYAARHSIIGQLVVIKTLRPEHATNREMVQRFFQEARAAAALDDPGVVRIYDQGVLPDGSAYIVMEHLQGESLAERLKRVHRLPAERALGFLRQVARAVGKGHARGIIHRDLKPDNLFIVPDLDVAGGERIKVLDFGIAKLLGNNPPIQTMAQMPMGTPDYMSPEQWTSAGEVDARTDIYALGVILFEILTGQVPFPGPGLAELVDQHRFMRVPSPSSIDPSLAPFDAVIQRALSKRAADRFGSLDELMQALPPTALPARPAHSPTEPPAWSGAPATAAPTPRYPIARRPTTLQGSASSHDLARSTPRRTWAVIATAFTLGTGLGLTVILAEAPIDPAAAVAGTEVHAPATVATVATKKPVATAAATVLPVAPNVTPNAAPNVAPVPPGATTAPTIPATSARAVSAEARPAAEPAPPPALQAAPMRTLPRPGRAAAPKPLPPPPPLPDYVDVFGTPELKRGLAKIRPQIERCGRARPDVRGRVALKFTIDEGGLVSFGVVTESPDAQLGLCVLLAIESGTFVKSKQGGRFTYRVSF